MQHRISLTTNSDLNASSQVLSWFEKINQPPLQDKNIWWQCQILVFEGFTNIAEHSHKHLPLETPIELEAIRSDKSIEIRIWSLGEEFDLEKTLQEIVELKDNYEDRGRGLKIMSAIADQLSYEKTSDNRYCLFISKSY